MIPLFLLSIYHNVIFAKNVSFFPLKKYGFVKNSRVFLNFSNISSKFVFGFGTNKEINYIKSLESMLLYCNGSKKLSETQFFVDNDTDINFTIPLKSNLTQFCISCSEMYKFQIYLTILN